MFTFKTRIKEDLKIQTGKNSRVFFKFSVLDNNLNLPTSFCSCYLELKTIDVLCFEILLGKTLTSTGPSFVVYHQAEASSVFNITNEWRIYQDEYLESILEKNTL